MALWVNTHLSAPRLLSWLAAHSRADVTLSHDCTAASATFLFSNQVHLADTKGHRMRPRARLTRNPRQYHAAHPDRCFVCRSPFSGGIWHTHEDKGAKTCSSTCLTRY